MTTLPPALDRFGAELEIAIRRDLGARRRRRQLLQATALSAAAAAVALGILAILPGGGSSVVGPAAPALEVSDNTILHVEMRGEQHNPDGSVVSWQSQSWQLSEALFTRRQIEVGPDGIRAESLVRGDTQELFDAETNTIYIASQKELAASSPLPKIQIVSKARLRELTQGSRAGVDAALRVRKGGKGYSVIAPTRAPSAFASSVPGQHRIRAAPKGRSTSRSAARSSRSSIPGAPKKPDASRSRGAMRSASSLRTGGRSTSLMPRRTRPSSGRAWGTAEASRSDSLSRKSSP